MIGGLQTVAVFNPGYFNGKIDFLKYFDRALGPAEIAAYTVPPQDTACAASVGVPVVSNDVTLRMYPNPATGCFYLESPGSTGPVQVALFDVTGRPVYRRTAEPSAGVLEIITLHLPEGCYYLQAITGAGKLYSDKIEILNQP